jgi:hypothetical protein
MVKAFTFSEKINLKLKIIVHFLRHISSEPARSLARPHAGRDGFAFLAHHASLRRA